jgi:iron complex outermembrane receptor protein
MKNRVICEALLTTAGFVTSVSAIASEAVESSGSDQLTEIVVTAQKRQESVQNIPISITAVGAEQIAAVGLTNLSDLGRLVPNFNFGIVTGAPVVSLRGISTTVIGISGESSIGLTMNSVPLGSLLYFDTGLFDLERAEVLHGPQGTVNGRNSTGGAINLVAARPTDEFDASFKLTGGNYSTFDVEGHVNGAITPILSARVAFVHNKSDGFLTYSSGQVVGGVDETGARVSLDLHPSNTIDALLIADYWHNDSAGPPFVALGAVAVNPPIPLFAPSPFPYYNPDNLTAQNSYGSQIIKRDVRGLSLNINDDISDSLSLRSVTGYRNLQQFSLFSGTDTPYSADPAEDPLGVGGVLNYNSFDRLDEIYSEELTLTSRGNGPLEWLVGGLALHDNAREFLSDTSPYLGLVSPGFFNPVSQATESYALYGQAQYNFTDQLRLTLGGRYTEDKKSMAGQYDFSKIPPPIGGFVFRPSNNNEWRRFTPRVALDYAVNKDALLYVSWATGYKAGGFDSQVVSNPLPCLGLAPGACQWLVYQPETVKTYELGAKTTWFDKRLMANIALFDSKFTNLQNALYESGGTVIVNAGESTSKGAELEIRALLSQGFTASLSGAYTDSTYTTFSAFDNVANIAATTPPGKVNLAGNQLPLTAKIAYNLGLEYKRTVTDLGTIVLNADYAWKDKTYFTFYNRSPEDQPSYGLLDLRATLGVLSDKLFFSVFARNVTDKRYLTNAVDVPYPSASVFTTGQFGGLALGNVGQPRMFGGSVEYKF